MGRLEMTTPDDVQRMFRMVKGVMAGMQPPSAADGGSSPLPDALAALLGENWWKDFPVENVESLITRFASGGLPFVSDRLVREMQAVVDRVKAERIAAETGEEVEDTWQRVTDQVTEERARRGPFKPDDDLRWAEGYAKGYAAGYRARIDTVTSTGVVLKVGDKVQKVGGDYRYPGQIVAIFRKGSSEGPYRVVVESTASETRGMLHIFNPAQLRKL